MSKAKENQVAFKKTLLHSTAEAADQVPSVHHDRIIDELKAFGRGRKLPKGMTIRNLIHEGQRF